MKIQQPFGNMSDESGKYLIRYITPIEDIYGVISGKDFDGDRYNRGEAAVWTAVSFIPLGKVVGAGGRLFLKGFLKTELKWAGKTFKDAGEFGKEVSNLAGNPREKRSLIESVTRDVAKKNGWKKSQSLSGKLGDEVYDAGDNIYMSVDKYHGDFEVFKKSGSKYQHQGSINIDGVRNKKRNPKYDKKL